MAEDNSQSGQVFTSTDRIRQLNDVDRDIAKLINSAGLAIQALTNAKPPETDPNTDPAPPQNPTESALDSHKKRFKEATSQYFALLSSIDVRLRRQVYALEEASVLAPDSASRTNDVPGAAGGGGGAVPAGSLDVSWLNSRKDTVGKDKEAELWAAAREFVERNGKRPGEVSGDGGQDKMEVD